MKCEERSGFLFAHDCDRVAIHVCSQCDKNICEFHSREVKGTLLCISCFKDARSTSTRPKNNLQDPFLYHAAGPFVYDYYDMDDYEVFNRTRVGRDYEGDPFDS